MKLALWVAALCGCTALIGWVAAGYFWYFFCCVAGVLMGFLLRLPGADDPPKANPLTIIDGPWEGEIRRIK